MKHLKKFNESSDNKLELLRDVFENLEDEFDVDVEYHSSSEKEKIISVEMDSLHTAYYLVNHQCILEDPMLKK